MNEIKFIKNWNNKLDCTVFTTIRKYTPQKFDYYSNHINETFNVILGRGNDKSKCQAVLKRVNSDNLKRLPFILLWLDTGLTDTEKIQEVFKDFSINPETKVIILTFERVKP